MKILKLAWLAAQYPDRVHIPLLRKEFFAMSTSEQIHFGIIDFGNFYTDATQGKVDLKAFNEAAAGKGFSERDIRNMRRELEYQKKKAQILVQ